MHIIKITQLRSNGIFNFNYPITRSTFKFKLITIHSHEFIVYKCKTPVKSLDNGLVDDIIPASLQYI